MATVPIPAPWRLQGNGYILLFRFKKDFLLQDETFEKELASSYQGGLGAVMLVDYQNSDAGPYGELLMIPGRVKQSNEKRYTISKIYVSTMASVENGRRNWGIPKELADFRFEKVGTNQERIKIQKDDQEFVKLVIDSFGPTFPVNTKLLPFPLLQWDDEQEYRFEFQGKGKGRLAKLSEISVNQSYFPDFGKIKPLMVLQVRDFEIIFPIAEITKRCE